MKNCEVNVIVMEYPGFGLHWDRGVCTEKQMIFDSRIVYKFVTTELKYDHRDLIVLGRSMGTGVATQLVRHMYEEPALLVLIQPYISI